MIYLIDVDLLGSAALGQLLEDPAEGLHQA